MSFGPEFMQELAKQRTQSKDRWHKEVDRAVDRMYDRVVGNLDFSVRPLPSWPAISRTVDGMLEAHFGRAGYVNTQTAGTPHCPEISAYSQLALPPPHSNSALAYPPNDRQLQVQMTAQNQRPLPAQQLPHRSLPPPVKIPDPRYSKSTGEHLVSRYERRPFPDTPRPSDGRILYTLPTPQRSSSGPPPATSRGEKRVAFEDTSNGEYQNSNKRYIYAESSIHFRASITSSVSSSRYDYPPNGRNNQILARQPTDSGDIFQNSSSRSSGVRQKQPSNDLSVVKYNPGANSGRMKIINPQKEGASLSPSSSPEPDFNGDQFVDRFTVLSYTCPECTKSFCDKRSLNGHLLSQHELDFYRCPQLGCNKSYDTRDKLDAHEGESHSAPGTVWNCYACPFVGKDSDQLTDHLDDEHQEGKFQCTRNGCSYISRTPAQAYTHYEHRRQPTNGGESSSATVPSSLPLALVTTARPNTGKLFRSISMKCPLDECFDFFIDEEDVNRHLNREHRLAPFICPIIGCTKSYNEMANLENHSLTEHRHLLYSLSCPKCGQSEDNLADLHRHLIFYHQEGQFKCTFAGCSKMDKYRGRIVEHYEREHC